MQYQVLPPTQFIATPTSPQYLPEQRRHRGLGSSSLSHGLWTTSTSNDGPSLKPSLLVISCTCFSILSGGSDVQRICEVRAFVHFKWCRGSALASPHTSTSWSSGALKNARETSHTISPLLRPPATRHCSLERCMLNASRGNTAVNHFFCICVLDVIGRPHVCGAPPGIQWLCPCWSGTPRLSLGRTNTIFCKYIHHLFERDERESADMAFIPSRWRTKTRDRPCHEWCRSLCA